MTMNFPRGNEVDPGQRCPGTTNHAVIIPGYFTVPGSREQAFRYDNGPFDLLIR